MPIFSLCVMCVYERKRLPTLSSAYTGEAEKLHKICFFRVGLGMRIYIYCAGKTWMLENYDDFSPFSCNLEATGACCIVKCSQKLQQSRASLCCVWWEWVRLIQERAHRMKCEMLLTFALSFWQNETCWIIYISHILDILEFCKTSEILLQTFVWEEYIAWHGIQHTELLLDRKIRERTWKFNHKYWKNQFMKFNFH